MIRCKLLACIGLLAFAAESQESAEPQADAPYSRDGADSCLACHDDPAILALFRTRHAVPTDPRGPFGHGQLQCEACHGPGGNHAGRVRRGAERPPPLVSFDKPASAEEAAEQNAMCTDCHSADTGFGWHGGPHESNDVACTGCHTSHTAADPVLVTASQPGVCADCHNLQHAETLKAYAHPIFEGKMDCSDCHSPHGETLEMQLVRQSVNDTCFACHAEKRGPYLWEHEPAAEDCTLCHAPHGSNQPGMLVRRAPLLCQSCHSQAGHPSIAQDADGLAAAMPSQFLLAQSCMNCHEQVHGSNHPSGSKLMR
jgi:DmsE family decaheme c-type cytochrome